MLQCWCRDTEENIVSSGKVPPDISSAKHLRAEQDFSLLQTRPMHSFREAGGGGWENCARLPTQLARWLTAYLVAERLVQGVSVSSALDISITGI